MIRRRLIRVDLDEVRLSVHPHQLRDFLRRVDSLNAVAHGRKVVLLPGAAHPVVRSGVDHMPTPVARHRRQLDHADVVQKERGFGEQRVRVPRLRLDGVRSRERIVVVAVLDVGFGEDAHAAEFAGLARAMSGREHDSRGEERSGTAKPGAGDIHHDEDDRRVAVAPLPRVMNDGASIADTCGAFEAVSQADRLSEAARAIVAASRRRVDRVLMAGSVVRLDRVGCRVKAVIAGKRHVVCYW